MEGSIECFDTLICSGAGRLTGYQRRLFMAEVTTELCKGSARQAERRFGWGRETVLKGLHESRQGIRCLENFAARGRLRSEEKDPQLAADIRAIVEPHTYADPQLKSSRRYTNLSAAEVREALIATGHPSEKLPSERTLRDILNRMNYRLKRIQKGKPLKKTKETDAIFANVKEVQQQARSDPETLEISMDTKAKVALGDYARGGKTRTDANGQVTKGWDHDPPAKEKQVPFGILMVVAGALTLLFGSRETSDVWADALQMWWRHVRAFYGHIKRLVIYLDNGPKNSGRRTQFLKRMVQFADWSGLELRLVYYPGPPRHFFLSFLRFSIVTNYFTYILYLLMTTKATANIVKRCDNVPQKLRFSPNAGSAIRPSSPILMRWPWCTIRPTTASTIRSNAAGRPWRRNGTV